MRLSLLLSLALFSTSALADNRTFGISGRDGRDVRPARDGSRGSNVTVNVDGSEQSFQLSGGNAEDAVGFGEDGTPASDCRQPRWTPYNLKGAAGGNGANAPLGGRGGNGGNIVLHLNSDEDFGLLKFVTVVNPGGRGGQSGQAGGRGGAGCRCEQPNWKVQYCTWNLFYTENGKKTDANDRREQLCFLNPDYQVRVPPPTPQGPSGRVYQWQLTSTRSSSFECIDGADGRDGSLRPSGSPGSYGSVTVRIGASMNQNPSISASVNDVINKSYELSEYLGEQRRGLQLLLRSGSDVPDVFLYQKPALQKVKFEWRAKLTPQEYGVDNLQLSAHLTGKPNMPKIDFDIPAKLDTKFLSDGETTVVQFIHVLNSTDPSRIAECAKNTSKGSYVCEFSGQCIYEPDGACLPK